MQAPLLQKAIVRGFSVLLPLMAIQAPVRADQSIDTVTVSAVGDIMIGNDFPVNNLPPNQGANIFRHAAQYIQAADIRFGNYEGTLFDGEPSQDAKQPGKNRHLFRAPTTMAPLLKKAGFNVLSLANNHSMDMGWRGFKSTQDVLNRLEIETATKHSNVTKFDVRGVQVAILAADAGPGPRSVLRPQQIFDEIAKLKKVFDVVILSSHIGGEGVGNELLTFQEEIFLGRNRGNPVALARGAIDVGADLIIFHGPHVPRAMEIYKGRLIAYSLGNFATMRGMNIQGPNGYAPVLRVQIAKSGEFIKGHIASFIQRRPDQVLYDPKHRAFKMIQRLSEMQLPGSSPLFHEGGYITPR